MNSLLYLLKPETREQIAPFVPNGDYDTLTELLEETRLNTQFPQQIEAVLNNLHLHLTDFWFEDDDGERPLGCASDLVGDFHEKMLVIEPKKPTLPDADIFQLRQRLIIEEIAELDEAWEAGDLEACADALTDQLYVLIGTFRMFGLGDRISSLFDEVHRSNMTKSGGGVRDDGKVLKGQKYRKPNIKHALEFGRDLI
jgi:predicted HAD superfamily Cof-like phosphohydrolase